MKPKTVFKLFLVTLIVVNIFYANAQVTIGNLSNPQAGALLDLKESDNVGLSQPNSSKGVLFPKVSLQNATSLQPLFTTTAEPQKTTSVGMIVYNVNASAVGLETGLYVWDGAKWIPIMNNSGAAGLVFQWNQVQVNGFLAKGRMLSFLDNTITIPVTVNRAGVYSIVAYSDPENNYYFSASGEFFSTGIFTVTLNGMGMPRESTRDRNMVRDKLIFYVNGVLVSPSPAGLPTLFVADNTLDYTYSCNSIDISNANLRQNESSEEAFIVLRLDVPASAMGSHYVIETNEVDGVKFSDEGTLWTNRQTVVLMSNGGIPRNTGIHNFYIFSNSSAVTQPTCPVEIPVVGRSIKVQIFATTDNKAGSKESYDLYYHGVGQMLGNPKLFGPDPSAYCQVDNISVASSNTFPANNGTRFSNSFDILIIGYNCSPTSTQLNVLNTFLNEGGVIFYCEGQLSSNPSMVVELLNRRYNTSGFSAALIGTTGGTFPLQTGNPIVNGGYTDLTGKRIGFDNGGDRYFTIPSEQSSNIQVLARDSKNNPIIFRTLNARLIVVGDAGFLAGGDASCVDSFTSTYPLKTNNVAMPVPKTKGTYSLGAYNAHFFVNAMIWAIKERLK
jgi:hypothetical protein